MRRLSYDEPICNLGMMEDKVDNPNPQDTPQVLPSFEVYTPPVTYLKEVKETIRIPIEVEPLDETQLDDLGLNTYKHDTPLSPKKVPSFDESEPQLKPLPNYPSLYVILGKEKGPESPINPNSQDRFRMKVVDHLTIHTRPSTHVVYFEPKDVYCYYQPCIDDIKKQYGFKLGLLGQSESLGVDLSDSEVIEDDFIEEGFNLHMGPKEFKKGRIKETHHLEHITHQLLFQHTDLSYHNGVCR
nr:ribonuclease H-like domain-containing protein [Tanacetum cinerariifolium]